MLGFFKKLLHKSPGETERPSVDQTVAPASKPAAGHAPNLPASAPPAPAPPVVTRPASDGPSVEIPLKAILKRLPGELLARVEIAPTPVMNASISQGLIGEQLRNGKVQITFGELIKASPAGIFKDSPRVEHSLVELPLSEVLNRIPKGMLDRRVNQKVIKISDNIPGLFGPKGEALGLKMGSGQGIEGKNVRLGEEIPKTARPAQGATVAPSPGAPSPSIAPGRQVTPTPAMGSPSPAGTVPPSTAAPAIPRPTMPAAVPATPAPAASEPIAISASLKDAFTAAVAAAKTSNVPMPSQAPPAVKVATTAGKHVVISLADLSAAFPAAVLQEISTSNLSTSKVSLPEEDLGTALKAGRVLFPWKQIVAWLEPTAPSGATLSPEADTLVELPLKVTVPAFLAQYQAPVRRRITPPDSIPAIFKPAGAAAAPTLAPTMAPASAIPEVSITSRMGQLLGKPEKVQWSPNDITQQLVTMPGVSGAVLATSDGLLVSGNVPANLKSETVAAFLPQVYTRLEQYTKELKLDGLGPFSFTAGGTPWMVLKAGTIYLVVIGRAGQLLPTAQLTQIVAELSPTQH